MAYSFSTLLDIDKLTQNYDYSMRREGFSTLLDIDKLTPVFRNLAKGYVLVLCWILINLHDKSPSGAWNVVLVLCWILINLHGENYAVCRKEF